MAAENFGRVGVRAVAVVLCICALGCGKITRDSPALPQEDAGRTSTISDSGVAGSASSIADAGKAPDASTPNTDAGFGLINEGAFELSGARAVGPQIASDRAGNALLMWSDLSGDRSVFWRPAFSRWSAPVSLETTEAQLSASASGDFPVAVWATPTADSAEEVDVAAQRFDFALGAWSQPAPLPRPSALYDWHFAVDAAGNKHMFWREDPEKNYWTWWRAADAQWAPALAMPEDSQLVAGSGSTFLWSDRDDLLVQKFDLASGTWLDPVNLRSLLSSNGLYGATHTLVTGRNDSALLVSYRRDVDNVVIEAWHWQPSSETWGPVETVMTVPLKFGGQNGAAADPSGDFVWVPFTTSDGSVELDVARYDPVQTSWQIVRKLPQGTDQSARLRLCFDDSGRAYGASPLAGLIRFDPLTRVWSESPELDIDLDFDSRQVFASAQGAFAVGIGTGQTVVAFKSDAAGEWRALSGLPPDPQDTDEALNVIGGLVGPERALVAWTVEQGTHIGLWASFVE